MTKKSVGFLKNQSVKRLSYLLSSPFPEEQIILGITKRRVLEFLYKGGNPHSISKSIKKGRSTTIQHLNELRKLGLAQKESEDNEEYGIPWKITDKGIFLIEKSVGFPVKSTRVAPNQSAKTYPPNYNRGHALQFKIQLPETIQNWTNERRKEILDNLGIKYKNLNLFGGGQGIIYQGKKIHLTNSSIIIYDSASYFAPLAEQSERNASVKILYLIRSLEQDFNNYFTINKRYKIKITRRHHALIKNEIANLYNKQRGKRLEVYDEKGLWLLIDNSWNLNELECVNSRTAVRDGDGMREIMNSFKRTDFKATSEFVLNGFDELKNNEQEILDHLKKSSEMQIGQTQVIKQMEQNLLRLSKVVYEIGGRRE